MKNEKLNFLLPPNNQSVADGEWLTTEEILARFKVKSPTTIRKHLNPAKKFGGKNRYPLSDVLRLWRLDLEERKIYDSYYGKSEKEEETLDISISAMEQASKAVDGADYQGLLERYVRCIISETGFSHTDKLHKHYTEKGKPLFTQKEKVLLVNTGNAQTKQFREELSIVQRRVSVICQDWVTFLNSNQHRTKDKRIIEYNDKKVNEKP